MRLLDGRELVGYIQERQAKQVRALRQAHHVAPKLAIIGTADDLPSQTYIRLKKTYGEDILIDVAVHQVQMAEVAALVRALNDDPLVHGIIVQLPLADPSQTDELLSMIAPHKDVDGLGAEGAYLSATVEAIDWLLAGYGVDLVGKRIALVGKGRLVGGPLLELWTGRGLDVEAYDDTTTDLAARLRSAQVIVSAAGAPGLIRASMVAPGAVIVDAGVAASEGGVLVGDVADDVRERGDITITPVRGGVGPLTVAVLFDHVIQAAQKTTS